MKRHSGDNTEVWNSPTRLKTSLQVSILNRPTLAARDVGQLFQKLHKVRTGGQADGANMGRSDVSPYTGVSTRRLRKWWSV